MIVSMYLAYKKRCDARRAAWRGELQAHLRDLDRLERDLVESAQRAGVHEAAYRSQHERLMGLRQRLAFVRMERDSAEARALELQIAQSEVKNDELMCEMTCVRAQEDAARQSLETVRATVRGELTTLKPLSVREMVVFILFDRHPARSVAAVAGGREIEAANRVFDLVEACVPRRIAHEELGDACELIQRLVAEGRPRWLVRVKIATTVFWVAVHAVGHLMHELRGRKGA